MTVRSMPTVLIDFKTERADAVRSCLDAFGNPARGSIRDRLDATKLIHCASISVIEASGPTSFILIELAADCDADDALAVFAEALSPDLPDLLRTAGRAVPAAWPRGLRPQRLGLGLFSTAGLPFDGCPAMSVKRIKRESDFADWIERKPDLLAGPEFGRRQVDAHPARTLARGHVQMGLHGRTDADPRAAADARDASRVVDDRVADRAPDAALARPGHSDRVHGDVLAAAARRPGRPDHRVTD